MAIVVVAGGTGGIGRAITEAVHRKVGEINMVIGKSKLDVVEALEKTSLEYTLFHVGYFLDL